MCIKIISIHCMCTSNPTYLVICVKYRCFALLLLNCRCMHSTLGLVRVEKGGILLSSQFLDSERFVIEEHVRTLSLPADF